MIDDLRRATHGDRPAWSRVVDAHMAWLLAAAAHRLRTRWEPALDARDICQDVVMRAGAAIGAYDLRPPVERSFKAWLGRILLNRINELARQRRGGLRLLEAELEGRGGSRHLSPSRRASGRERRVRLAAMLGDLSTAEQQLIRLHYFDDRTLAEVARALDRTPEAVNAALHRLRKRLRTEMGRSSMWLSS